MVRPSSSSMGAGSLASVAAWMLATTAAAAATATESESVSGTRSEFGYTYGQAVPVTCLNRTIDSGEHITDTLGKLQYIPFPICKETGQPLALRYGITETVNCTIASLSDVQYHLFEYYVHSDVPLTCRVPTTGAPGVLDSVSLNDERTARDAAEDGSGSGSSDEEEEGEGEEKNQIEVLDISGPAYTPITLALQGTLQRSHLHIWTDMNVLLHKIASRPLLHKNKNNKKNKKSGGYGGSGDAGFIVAGTAYSVPEYHPGANPVVNSASESAASSSSEPETDDDDDDSLPPKEKESLALAKAARDPWTAGHGTKVVRGEPLTFTFHVTWLEGGDGIGWPSRNTGPFAVASSSSSTSSGIFSRLFLLAMAASVGALVALYFERRRGRRQNGYFRTGWKGDGILGVPPMLGGGMASVGNGIGGGGGGSGRMNGYGGYTSGSSAASSSAAVGVGGGGGGYGYGGYLSGKKD